MRGSERWAIASAVEASILFSYVAECLRTGLADHQRNEVGDQRAEDSKAHCKPPAVVRGVYELH